MDARQYLLNLIDRICRHMELHDDVGSPTWSEGQFIRGALRFERGDASAWLDFQQRLEDRWELTLAVREMLVYCSVVLVWFDSPDVTLDLPRGVEPLSTDDECRLLRRLNARSHGPQAVFADPLAWIFPAESHLYRLESAKKFVAPAKASQGEIMYVELKPGLAGPARIARVTLSRTRKTIYFDGRKLQSLKGTGYKANYYNVETGAWYWVSKCRQDGNDALYPATVEIDEEVREEYWTEVRKQPENKHLTKFRSPGKYSKRRPS